jgi:hypothetical protein
MTPYDQQVLFTALAFITVVSNDSGKLERSGVQKIMKFADLIGEFCAENVPVFYAGMTREFPGQSGKSDIDTTIEQYIGDLHEGRAPALPRHKEPLMQLYVRLQFRKIYRINALLFESADTHKMASCVLAQLKEETEFEEKCSHNADAL